MGGTVHHTRAGWSETKGGISSCSACSPPVPLPLQGCPEPPCAGLNLLCVAVSVVPF